MPDQWSPERYLRFASERARPFRDLVARVEHPGPRVVADLGCGPGALTATLPERWPGAFVVGVDASPSMLALAGRRARPGRLGFVLADLATWSPAKSLDVIVSNATFHWLADHAALLDRLLGLLAPGGVLAFQVPANADAPSHRAVAELVASTAWRDRLEGTLAPGAATLEWYVEHLAGRGCAVDAWQTTYVHLLDGDDAVLRWLEGTTLRPILAALETAERPLFLQQLRALLREAYPHRGWGTAFPFTRRFVVASSPPVSR
jgi:trans-aconitate 2-methyltransferase